MSYFTTIALFTMDESFCLCIILSVQDYMKQKQYIISQCI